MSYVSPPYVQQPQTVSNVVLQSTAQPFSPAAPQYYYDQTLHAQQVYVPPVSAQSIEVGNNGGNSLGNSSNYFHQQQGQYNQENLNYSSNVLASATSISETPYSCGSQMPHISNAYVSNEWQYHQNSQPQSYQSQQYQVQHNRQPQSHQNIFQSQQIGYQNLQQNQYSQSPQNQLVVPEQTQNHNPQENQYSQSQDNQKVQSEPNINSKSLHHQQGQPQQNRYSQSQHDQQGQSQQNRYTQSQHGQQGQSQQNQYSQSQLGQQGESQQNRYSQSQYYQQGPSQQNRYSQSQHDQQGQSQQNRYTQSQHDQQGQSQQNRYTQSQHDQQGQSQQNRYTQSQHDQQGQSQQNRYTQSQHGQQGQSQQNRYSQSQHDQQGQSQQNRYPQSQHDQQGQSKQNKNFQSQHDQQGQSQENKDSQSQHDQQGQSQQNKDSQSQHDQQGQSKQSKCSPLNDFGDMGAAVQKYAQSVPTKSSLFDSSELSTLEERRKLDSNKYRQEHGLIVWDDKGKAPVPDPFEHFEDIPALKEVQLNAFYKAGFQAPTPIQAQTWPIVLKERDVVSIAKTGSGKTLAFLLPAYQKIDAKFGGPRKVIHVLVLAPTRELAMQIEEEANKFGSVAGHHTACAYGGAPKRNQLEAINAGASVLVATPGRLNDFIDSRQVNLSSVFYLVMDEADRMLDMGFEPQIRSILRRLPKQRQTLMFSATWPEEVRRLANDFLVNPIHIRLGSENSLQANENIKQYLILLKSGEDKDHEVHSLLRSKISKPGDSILVFVARKNTCNFVANMLNRLGVSAAAMHGDRTQEFREETLAAFKDGKLPVLVATDVASRGLDVKGLLAVVNYDMPGSTEDYVHRIGRTGRAGLTGESYTFLSHSNEDIWKALSIVEVMEKTGQTVPTDVQVLIDQLKEKQKHNSERRAAEDQQFSKVLMVAEKPSVAKMIADSLSSNGRYRTRKGKSRANQIFEFIKWFEPAQQKCKIMVTSVVGHIFGLSFENQQCRDVAMLFDAPVKKVIEETSKKLCIVDHLQELGNESQYLYLWLDCDREGENIGFEVISLTQDSIPYDNVYRARFSSLTTSELNYAYSNPIRPDKYSAMSVDARQELDLKIGVAFTRLMTRTYLDQARTKFRLKDQKCISYGPCQTPTLWFCVQRHKEIQRFERKQYFVLSVNINIQGQDYQFQYINEEVDDMEEAEKIGTAVSAAQNAVVIEVKEECKTAPKPVGLNTVTLLKACSKGLGMSPTSAMHAAEHLYTSGFISYPRTETTAYSPSFDLVSVLEEQANHPHWGRVATYLLTNGRVNPPVKGHDAGDHPPITPMRAASRNEITKANEWRIYDYVTRHFIASLHNNLEYKEYKVKVNIGGYDFCFTCHEVLDRGFAFAMPWKEKSLNLNEVKFHPQQSLQGQSFSIKNFNKEESYTKPPDYLQESELISLMDKHGIGTDASIPQHIKNVQDRHYVDICGPGEDGQKGTIIPIKKYFGKNNRGGGQQAPRPASRHMVPRGFGLAFLSCFENLDYELCEPTIRSYMEKQITKIATGETEKSEVVLSNLKLFLNKFQAFRQNLHKVDRYFVPKVFPDNAGQLGRNGGNFDNIGNNNGYERGRGRGRGRGFHNNEGRGRGFHNERRGRGFQNDRGKRGNQPYGNADDFKRQKTWE